jgi:signal transduction histidine kinase
LSYVQQPLIALNDEIVNQAPLCILVFKADGPCIFANSAAETLFGVTIKRFKNHNFRRSECWQRSGNLKLAIAVLQTGGKQTFSATLGKRRLHIVGSLSCVKQSEQSYLLAIFSEMSHKVDSERVLLAAREVAVDNLQRALLAEKQLAEISAETRKAIGQELHDDLGQHLTGLAFLADNLAHIMQLKNLPEAMEAARISGLIKESIEKTRTLTRRLLPEFASEADLQAHLFRLLRHVESTFGISCELNCSTVMIEDPVVAGNLFRIAQEAVNNAIKHSGATKITISFNQTDHAIVLQIVDNGSGFASQQDSGVTGLGIEIMRRRASLFGAKLTIEPGVKCGANLVVTLPTQH